MKFDLRKMFASKHDEPEPDCPSTEKLPVHIAFIMDGNGRWATRRGLPRSAGHAAGTEALRQIIRTCSDIGIKHMTIYAFSTENWNRPAEEVDALMKLINRYFTSEIDELIEKNVRIRILGDLAAFREEQRLVLEEAMERTSKNTGLNLNIALNYGGRAELLGAVRAISQKCTAGTLKPEEISFDTVSDHLYTQDQPDVDLLIRTGGDERISNFLLWQTWYAELIFEPCLWPDYDQKMLYKDLNTFASRDRRFGRVKTK